VSRRVTLLGPQRLRPTVAPTLASLGVTGRIATITAGWQEREPEDQELHEHVGERSVNLRLWQRAENAFQRDPELATAHHHRQARLHEMQDLYNVRLNYAMEAAYALLARHGDPTLLTPQRGDAVMAIRELDTRHLERIHEIHAEFTARWRPHERDAVVHERRELESILHDVSAIAIAGGHVAVLLNRLLLFNLAALIGDRPVVAWSAGAMAISERVVLFYDTPPHGPGHPEVLEAGLGLARGIVPLPHARRRLRFHDPVRVGLFARRFAPALCVPMDEGARVDVDEHGCSAPPEVLRLVPDGTLEAVAA
jgi:hypothetical protein